MYTMLKYVQFKFAGPCDGLASCHDLATWLPTATVVYSKELILYSVRPYRPYVRNPNRALAEGKQKNKKAPKNTGAVGQVVMVSVDKI